MSTSWLLTLSWLTVEILTNRLLFLIFEKLKQSFLNPKNYLISNQIQSDPIKSLVYLYLICQTEERLSLFGIKLVNSRITNAGLIINWKYRTKSGDDSIVLIFVNIGTDILESIVKVYITLQKLYLCCLIILSKI